MAYATCYYYDYTTQCKNNFLTQIYKNIQQYTHGLGYNNYGFFNPSPTPMQLFSFCDTDSCKNWAYTGFKYPTLPERKLSMPSTAKAPNIDFAKFEETKKQQSKLNFNDNTLAYNENGFLDGVKAVARNINCNYKDLLAVINAECGFKHHKPNKKSGAVGLIQFMPKTAKRLGTSTEELSNMSATDQLVYVEKFLKRCKKTYGFSENAKLSGADLYSLVFLPARAKRNVLCSKGETNKDGKAIKFYDWNKGMDLDKDGKITKAEIAKRVDKFRVQDIAMA